MAQKELKYMTVAEAAASGQTEAYNQLVASYAPKPNPVSFLSTENAATNVNKDLTKLNTYSPSTAPNYVEPPEEPEVKETVKEGKAYFVNENGQEIEFTESQLKQKGNRKFLEDNGYYQTKAEFNTSVGLGKSDEMTESLGETDKELEDLYNEFKNYNVEDDPGFRSIKAGIEAKYEQLRVQMRKTNESRAKALQTMGLRSGSAEFAGSIQSSIEGGELSQANQRLTDITSQEEQAIAAARSAYETGEWNNFSKQIAALETIRENKAEVLESYNEKLAGIINTAREEETQASRDSAIAGLIQQGITSPTDMLEYLNFNDNGEMIGDFTAKEISETMKFLAAGNDTTVDKLTGDTKNFFVLKQIPGMLPSSITSLPQEQQLGAYIKWNKSLTTSATAGAAGNGYGTGLSGFDKFSDESIALSVIPSTLRNSEVELKRFITGINLGLENGLTPYEIADNLMGYKIDNKDSFSESFRQYISLANLNGQEIGNMARLINSGNKEAAVAYVENKILANQKSIDPEGYVGEATPRYYVEKVKQIKQTIADAGLTDKIGPLEGTFQQVLGKLKWGEAAKIKSQVTSLVAEMRNHLAGTAVTSEEKKFLEPLVASLSDKNGIFMQKLDEISTNSLSRHNATRRSGGLPEVNEDQLINRKARISLYTNMNYDPQNSIDTEVNAEKALSNYIIKNPDKQDEITELISNMEQMLGRPIDASEFYQVYPNYK